MPKRILCFGDSNTFGWIGSLEGPARRFPSSIRWTGRLSALLGQEYEIIEEGLGGRTLRDNFTVGSGVSVPGAGLSGKDYLPACLLSHLPLDAVVIMLGSNDMKSALGRSEHDIAEGMAELADIVLTFPWQELLDYPRPGILIVSPPLIGERKMALAGERYVDAPASPAPWPPCMRRWPVAGPRLSLMPPPASRMPPLAKPTGRTACTSMKPIMKN